MYQHFFCFKITCFLHQKTVGQFGMFPKRLFNIYIPKAASQILVWFFWYLHCSHQFHIYAVVKWAFVHTLCEMHVTPLGAMNYLTLLSLIFIKCDPGRLCPSMKFNSLVQSWVSLLIFLEEEVKRRWMTIFISLPPLSLWSHILNFESY